MIIEDIKYAMLRDVDTLCHEINKTPDADVWTINGDIKNPIGTLALHLAGNLRHYIGQGLGNSGYVRDRPLEFADRTASRQQMLDGLEAAKVEVADALDKLSDSDLSKPFPELVPWTGKTIGHVLILLCTHLSYHLGQVNYLRRSMMEV